MEDVFRLIPTGLDVAANIRVVDREALQGCLPIGIGAINYQVVARSIFDKLKRISLVPYLLFNLRAQIVDIIYPEIALTLVFAVLAHYDSPIGAVKMCIGDVVVLIPFFLDPCLHI